MFFVQNESACGVRARVSAHVLERIVRRLMFTKKKSRLLRAVYVGCWHNSI